MDKPCTAAGRILPRGTDTRFGNTICPDCNGIAQTEPVGDADRISWTHTVTVILGDDD